MTFFCRFTKFHEANACIFKNLLDFSFVLICYLYNDTRIFCKQNLDNIITFNLVKFDFHTAFCVGETHFKQCSDKTTCRNIVTCKNQFLVDKFLNCEECIAEVFWVLYCRNIATYLVEALSKSRTSKTQLVETEVYMIECRFFLINHNRRNHLLDVAYFTTCRNDYCSRADNLFSVRIFLSH